MGLMPQFTNQAKRKKTGSLSDKIGWSRGASQNIIPSQRCSKSFVKSSPELNALNLLVWHFVSHGKTFQVVDLKP